MRTVLGSRLRRLRKKGGYTLADINEQTELSVSFLSDVERGRTNPSLDTLEKLAELYGVSASGLLKSEEEDVPAFRRAYPESLAEFIEQHPEISPEMESLLLSVERKAKSRASTAEDWNRFYYSLLSLLGE